MVGFRWICLYALRVYKDINVFWMSLGICYTVVSIQDKGCLDVLVLLGVIGLWCRVRGILHVLHVMDQCGMEWITNSGNVDRFHLVFCHEVFHT